MQREHVGDIDVVFDDQHTLGLGHFDGCNAMVIRTLCRISRDSVITINLTFCEDLDTARGLLCTHVWFRRKRTRSAAAPICSEAHMKSRRQFFLTGGAALAALA